MANVVKLTKRLIETKTSTEKDEVLWCSTVKGFGVRFYPSGKKAFILKRRVGSGRLAKQRKMTLGTFPAMSLAVAQKRAVEAIAKMQAGEDVVKQRVEIQRAAKERRDAEMSVSDAIEKWLQTDALRSRMRGPRFGTLRNPRDVKSNGNQLKRHVIPLIGKVKLSELTRKDIEKMRDDVAGGKTAVTEKTGFRGIARVTGGEGTAGKVVRILSTVLSYAVREGHITVNPASGIIIPPSRKVERYLSRDEQTRLEQILTEMSLEPKFERGVAIIRLLMLTGCRKNEIETLEWKSIDFERKFVRFGKSKTGAKIIPFSQAALDIIKLVPRFESSKFVFPSYKIDDYYKGVPKVWNEARHRAKIEDCRLHDLRHNFASVAASNGASLPMIGALLGHTQAQTTARYAHLTNHSLVELAEQISATIDERSNVDRLDNPRVVVDMSKRVGR
ncbi:MAG: site-specific integrase [Hyphomonadaceae bacterium]|nr:site-specific integrase [Hyphomonadaceae bacterium]